MKKQFIGIMAALLLAILIIYMESEPVSAASGSERISMSVSVGIGNKPCEKTGAFYIWITEKGNNACFKYAKSASAKGKTLHQIKGSGKWISPYMVVNGRDIYYTVNRESKPSGKSILYKAKPGGNPHKIAELSGQAELYTYYKGMFYYGAVKSYGGDMNLYSYDTAGKRTKQIAKGVWGQSGYGNYITYANRTGEKQFLYNVVTKKAQKLPKAAEAIVYKNSIYYYISRGETAIVKTCSLSGKNVKTIKTLQGAQLEYLGKKAASFIDYNTGNRMKLLYKTRSMKRIK